MPPEFHEVWAELRLAQAAISQQFQSLESCLDVMLFIRANRSVSLIPRAQLSTRGRNSAREPRQRNDRPTDQGR
ncbi:helix-turn-helix domain-containing protein [Pseudomonas sp. EA_65y_Pfl2_P74]|uniref:helix-turn-helix domain-containing protein n=1 Tax=Pseudomonas sp. EA_65y_Pfl2_P74 TaxID=3088694 RepID=UPI00403F2F17